MKFFATAAKGTEGALREELRELRLRGVKGDRGGVHFEGEWEDGFFSCLHSRIALRILTPLATFEAGNATALYEGVQSVDFTPYITTKHTLAVTATAKSSALTHTDFIAQKTKDAIVDQFRVRKGVRPSVSRGDPDLPVFIRIVENFATLYIDLTGESLHRRGYRERHIQAPLKETLAAAMLRISGWDRTVPLVDPLCGSGTIAIEAAMWARNIPPGIFRNKFCIERWSLFGEGAAKRFNEIRTKARENILPQNVEIFASDIDDGAIGSAEKAAKVVGVKLNLKRASIFDIAPPARHGFVVTNPPYGKRLVTDKEFYKKMMVAFRRFNNYTISLLLEKSRARLIAQPKAKTHTLYNGDIECMLTTFQQ